MDMKNIYTAIVALLCGADSLIKYAIERNHPDGELRPALHGKIIIRKFHNKGAMLNLGASRQQTMAVLSVIFTVFMTGVLWGLWEPEAGICSRPDCH